MNATQLIKILLQAGWFEIRQTGNHRIFRHSTHPNLISVPDLGDQPLTADLINDIFREAGLKARIGKIRLNLSGLLNMLKNILGLSH
jgi:predicted RNA binding protein YcfA (HicA-like mRNA interferase family)